MDIFEQRLFNELTAQYSQFEFSVDDYEELYMRFCNMEYLTEVQPYLLTMRFFGLGTVPERDSVLSELKEKLGEDDYMLKGLYYDFLLSVDSNNADALTNLRNMIEKGYTNIFTKEKSFVEEAMFSCLKKSREKNPNHIQMNSGYIFNWIDESSADKIILQNPYILLTDYKISSIYDILHIIEPIAVEKVPLLIIAKEVDGEVLEILKFNCQREILTSVVVRVAEVNESEVLNNIAMNCKATVISEKNDISLVNAGIDMLGKADSATIDRNTTIIVTDGECKNKIANNEKQSNEDVVVDYMTFECNGFNGLYFTAGDIDYLSAKVFIKPLHGKKHIKVRSQIFLNDNSFSKVFNNEYDIDSNTRWFKTQGWGNIDYNCYRNNLYKWVVEIDGKTTYSQEFRMYDGKLNSTGPSVNDVKLFASRFKGALEKDLNNYKTAFDGSTLETVYFKFLINIPGENMNVQTFIKVTYLEDGSVFRDNYFLHQLGNNSIAFWCGIGFSTPGKWKKGLYQYSARIGNGSEYEGTFSVY